MITKFAFFLVDLVLSLSEFPLLQCVLYFLTYMCLVVTRCLSVVGGGATPAGGLEQDGCEASCEPEIGGVSVSQLANQTFLDWSFYYVLICLEHVDFNTIHVCFPYFWSPCGAQKICEAWWDSHPLGQQRRRCGSKVTNRQNISENESDLETPKWFYHFVTLMLQKLQF